MGRGLLAGAMVIALVGLAAATVGDAQVSLVMYLVTLVLGTACVAGYRLLEVRRSLNPGHVIPSTWVRRLAAVPALFVVLGCMANAFVWATEVSKR